MELLVKLVLLSHFVNFAHSEEGFCGPDFPTVVVRKARGRIGNHIWLLMTNIAFELTYPGVKSYITEDSRWILDKFFKNYGNEDVEVAEKDLCGFKAFYSHFEHYLDTQIIQFYEERSGVRLPIVKPPSPYMANRLEIPPEIALQYPISVPDLILSQPFRDGYQPKKYKTENCQYEWETFEGPLSGFQVKNKAYLLFPSTISHDQTGSFFNVSGLPEELEKRLELKDEFMNDAQLKLTKVKQTFKSKKKETIFVGIHSRRTDHLAFQVKRNLKPLDASYYMNAIDLYRQKFPSKQYNVAFIWVSDDLQWGREKIGTKKGGKNVFFIGAEEEDKAPYDLALLASCNHTILSHGSFTYFAGFLAKGYKIVPQHFIEYQSEDLKGLRRNPFDFPLPRLHFLDTLE